MSLFLIRSTLRAGWRVGLAVGAGIALIDGIYAACGAAGAAPLLDIEPIRWMLGLAVGAFLIVLGFRALHSATTTQAAVLLVVGVAVGSLSWVTALASGVAVARRVFDDRAAQIADAVAGLAMVGVGRTLVYATAHER